MVRKIGWDKNLQIYRYLARGERTRGLIIINPKKLTRKRLEKLYIRYSKDLSKKLKEML